MVPLIKKKRSGEVNYLFRGIKIHFGGQVLLTRDKDYFLDINMDLITRNSITYKISKEVCRHHNHPPSSSPLDLLLIGFIGLLFGRRRICFRR